MKVLVVALYAINNPHLETELEIIQNHLDEGDEVTVMGCDISLLTCDANPWHDLSGCVACVGRREAGLRLLSERVPTVPLYHLSEHDKAELQTIRREFVDLEDLRGYRIDNFEIGYGILSSLISIRRDPEPDLRDEGNRRLLTHFAVSSLAVYRSLRNYFDQHRIDRVYIYNGRYAPLRAVLRACQAADIECYTHETGCDLNHYALYRNTTIHDFDNLVRLMRDAWEKGDPEVREKIGTEFFIESSRGIIPNWFSYTSEQKQGELPEDWNATKVNVSIFPSSEDEFAAMGDSWRNPVYADQVDGIQKIVGSLRDDTSIHLYIRMHPNLKSVKNRQTETLSQLSGPNITVIPPESPVSTYTLLQNSAKVITFGSTVGIEATFWKIPSILAGMALYRPLDATYNPRSHEELIEMVRSQVSLKNIEGALIYGYYLKTYGIPFKYVNRTGIFEGTFRGVTIQPRAAHSLLRDAVRNRYFGRALRRVVRRVVRRTNWQKLGFPVKGGVDI